MADAVIKGEDTAFTPGPWEVMPIKLTPDWAEAFDIVHGDDHQILVNDVASEADAYLIAAAPELLAAVDALTTVLGQMPAGESATKLALCDAYDLAIAAMNKAEGRS